MPFFWYRAKEQIALVRSFGKEEITLVALFKRVTEKIALLLFLKEVQTFHSHEIPLIYGSEFALLKEQIANFLK